MKFAKRSSRGVEASLPASAVPGMEIPRARNKAPGMTKILEKL
jgi:hypothetical protein